MNEIKIESGIPIPPSPLKGRSKYPFKDMAIGDSFVVKSKGRGVVAGFYYAAKHLGMKAKVSEIDGGYRVWRIA